MHSHLIYRRFVEGTFACSEQPLLHSSLIVARAATVPFNSPKIPVGGIAPHMLLGLLPWCVESSLNRLWRQWSSLVYLQSIKVMNVPSRKSLIQFPFFQGAYRKNVYQDCVAVLCATLLFYFFPMSLDCMDMLSRAVMLNAFCQVLTAVYRTSVA